MILQNTYLKAGFITKRRISLMMYLDLTQRVLQEQMKMVLLHLMPNSSQ